MRNVGIRPAPRNRRAKEAIPLKVSLAKSKDRPFSNKSFRNIHIKHLAEHRCPAASGLVRIFFWIFKRPLDGVQSLHFSLNPVSFRKHLKPRAARSVIRLETQDGRLKYANLEPAQRGGPGRKHSGRT
jgi:hypothetical protein